MRELATALCIALVFVSMFIGTAVTETAREKTKQYELRYNDCK